MLRNNQAFLGGGAGKPSDSMFKEKFINGPFTKLKYAKCLIHICVLIAFLKKDTVSYRSQEDIIWGKRLVQFLGNAEIQPGCETEWNGSTE